MKMIRRIKWLLLKRKLFKMNKQKGGDFDGDIVTYNGVKYYVNMLDREIIPMSTPVPDFAKKSRC